MASSIRSVGAAAGVALFLFTAGCHVYQPYPPTPSSAAEAALRQLKSLPSLEDTRARAQHAVAEIKAAADRLLPGLEWVSLHGESGANCMAPYEQSDGKSLYLPDEVAPGADVSDTVWAELAAAARTEAATLGATTTQVMQDGPRNHDVGFYSATGTFIKIGYQGNLTIASFTGCRLPASTMTPQPSN